MDVIESIRIFKRLTERRSFSAVAQELGVTQPTVSKAIASLEKSLGIPLFRRSSRGLSLTSEGQELLLRGGPLVDHLDEVLASMKDEKLLLTGSFTISSSYGFARVVLAPMLEEFLKLHPGLHLKFVLSDGPLNLIEQGIDLAIRLGEQEDSSLRVVKVGESRRSFYASRRYVKAHGMPKTIEDLQQHRLLFYNRLSDKPMWPYIDKNGKRKNLTFEPYIQSDGAELLGELTVRGVGIGLIPTWVMTDFERKGQVVRVLDKYCVFTFPTYVITPGPREMSAKQRAMTEFLKKKFDEWPEMSLRSDIPLRS
jgi:DNA-binding transcriptional LysR family regulator